MDEFFLIGAESCPACCALIPEPRKWISKDLGGLGNFFKLESSRLYQAAPATYPEYRRERPEYFDWKAMGELPHGYVEVYTECRVCESCVHVLLYFENGKLERREIGYDQNQ